MATATDGSTSSAATATGDTQNRITDGAERERILSREAQQYIEAREHQRTPDRGTPGALKSRDDKKPRGVNDAAQAEKEEVKRAPIDTGREEQEQFDRKTIARRNLEEHFKQSGRHYHFRANESVVAFTEDRTQIVTKHETDVVVRGMVDAAETKGWKLLQVDGSEEFKQKVWIEASSRNLDVRGYKATDHDLHLLEERRLNRIERADHTTGIGGGQSNVDATVRPEMNARTQNGTGAPAAPIEPAYEKIVAMGAAPYKFDTDESKSYYVKLEAANGQERTVWGKDLERATQGVVVGDEVRLHLDKKTPVQVTANVRDDENRVIGTKQVDSQLNTWNVEKRERVSTVAKEAVQDRDAPPTREIAAVKAIEERSSELSAVTLNELSKGGAREAVRDDRADFGRIKTADLKERAAAAIGHNADAQRNYRRELSADDPVLLAKAERTSNQLPDIPDPKNNDKKKEVVLATLEKVVEQKALPLEMKGQVMAEASKVYDERVQQGRTPVVQLLDIAAPKQDVQPRRTAEQVIERERTVGAR